MSLYIFLEQKNETCKVSCPGGITETNINGILDFVIKEQRHKFDNIITVKTKNSGNLNLDLGFSLSILFGKWKTALFSIAITIIIFILMVIYFPIIIQSVTLCLIKVTRSIYSLKTD